MTKGQDAARGRAGTPLLMLVAFVASGCAWDQHVRPLRDAEPLVLESMVVELPARFAGWSVTRRFDAGGRAFSLTHSSPDGSVVERLDILEADAPLPPAPLKRDSLARHAASLVGDEAAEVSDLPAVADPRFGPSAAELALRATEGDARAGILVKRLAWDFQLAFSSPGGAARACVVAYSVSTGRTGTPFPAEERWRELLAAIRVRGADAANVREAALTAGDFPKQMETGLARRSLTLPRGALQWSLRRERWLEHGGFDGAWGLHLGLTDQLELSAPGYVRYSFGEPEALTRPEYAVGIGWNGITHDSISGNTWGFGATGAVRKRLGADLAWRAGLALEWTHESRTARDAFAGSAAAGVLWDAHRWVTLGVEAGHARWLSGREEEPLTWVGGRSTPLVTVHLPLLDVGLDGAVAWEGGEPGVLAGISLRLTL